MSRPRVLSEFKKAVRKRARGRCEICGRAPKKLYVHHTRWPLCDYPQDANDPERVLVVCAKCHRRIHGEE